jgi:hypothetical protein
MCIEINIYFTMIFICMKEKFLHLYEHNFQIELQTNNHVNQLNNLWA